MTDLDVVETLERDGYAVVEDVLDEATLNALRDDVARVTCEQRLRPSPNAFEGPKTVRIYNLLAHGPLYARIPVDPRILPIVERVLGPDCLVNSYNAIVIGPGERAQVLHVDDQLIPIPRPHPAVVCNTIWALVDFRADNGATHVVPGSHRSDSAPVTMRDLPTARTLARQARKAIPVVMRAGSVLVYHGSLWHFGGPNHSDTPRPALAMNYCAGFIRQQENHFLGLATDVVAQFTPRLQSLLGYDLYGGLIGHVEKRHPREFLGQAPETGGVLFEPTSPSWRRS